MQTSNALAIGLLAAASVLSMCGAFTPSPLFGGVVLRSRAVSFGRPEWSAPLIEGFGVPLRRSPAGLEVCMAASKPAAKKAAAPAPKAAAKPKPKAKAEVDDDAEEKPKRPLSAYFRFAGDKRATVKASFPKLNNTEIVRKLGELWREASPSEKKVYEQAAAAAKKVYDETVGAEIKAKKEAEKALVKKKPLSAYMFFATEIRPKVKKEHPTATFGQVAKIIGEQWHSLPAPQKEKYIQMQAKAKKDLA